MLELHVTRRGLTEMNIPLAPGDVVTYLAHVPGGMVKIKLPDGRIDIAHPACFTELQA